MKKQYAYNQIKTYPDESTKTTELFADYDFYRSYEQFLSFVDWWNRPKDSSFNICITKYEVTPEQNKLNIE